MYLPALFEETRGEVIRELIASYPLGMLVTFGKGGLAANPIPFEWVDDGTPHGVLQAHVARANPLWQEHDRSVPALVVFQGPQAYITPTWYQTKADTHKVVPTYNYCIVQAHGPLVVHDDPAWTLAQVTRLTAKFEDAREKPWDIGDAPADFIAAQVRAIVGIELPIHRLVGKWKVSQNRPLADRSKVAEALAGDPMGALVHAYSQARLPPP